MMSDTLFPPELPPTDSELELHKLKSGIIINETKSKEDLQDYDSFELAALGKSRPE